MRGSLFKEKAFPRRQPSPPCVGGRRRPGGKVFRLVARQNSFTEGVLTAPLAGNQALRATTVVVARGERFSSLSLAEIRSPKEFQRLPPLQNLFRKFLWLAQIIHVVTPRQGFPACRSPKFIHRRSFDGSPYAGEAKDASPPRPHGEQGEQKQKKGSLV